MKMFWSRRSLGLISKFVPTEVPVAHQYKGRHFSSDRETKNDFFQREQEREAKSILQAFASKKNQFMELHRYNPLEISQQRLSEWKNRIKKEVDLEQQKYLPERHEKLGSDLAAAHFIVYRGGRVKFEGGNWIELDKDKEECLELPGNFVRGMYLDSLDASNMDLRYEAAKNFSDLKRLKWLSFRNCPYFDDWFLDKITGEFFNTLEYLDISECNGISECGLSCIYRLTKLKTLCVTNVADSRTFEFNCLLLEDSLPNLTIEGIKYIDVNCDNL